ncbi:hypothetical protein K439DRAFT_1658001 [Ramaria rubella]|nr:hypothetical protein K439DRAFT_1658001 [Ramaria rubella]
MRTIPDCRGAQWTPTSSESPNTFSRPLGDSEYAFFRSSSTGLGDMFLHLALRAPIDMMRRERVRVAWSIVRIAHPLLMSKIRMEEDVRSAKFSFTLPRDAQGALDEADRALEYVRSSKEDLIFNYMNGPRMLSNEHISHLIISRTTNEYENENDHHIFMCAPHFTGDGTSLHQATHELLVLLASTRSDAELYRELEGQLQRVRPSWPSLLPPAFETRLKAPSSPLGRAACTVNFLQTQQREVGAHIFPREQRAPQRTRLIEHVFSEEETKTILAVCKQNGVSINNALVAVCCVAWAKTWHEAENENVERCKLPIMIYTAINLRPHLTPSPSLSLSTYWFLALTYYTISLPAFLPRTAAAFWYRARLAKAQTTRAVKSPFLAARALLMASQRAASSPPTSESVAPQLPSYALPPPPTAPSRALLGLSLIGNLDTTYSRTAYARPGVHLHSVTTASRQKAGGLLLLAHTFGGKLVLGLCWDEVGFVARGGEHGGDIVEEWWEGVMRGVGEFCLR